MKILQIIPSFGLAGAETMVQDLILSQKAMGHDVSAISFFDCDTPITKKLKENNVNIYFLHKKKGHDFFAIKKIRDVVRKLQPEVIHTHLDTVYSFLATIGLENITKIHTVHNIAEKEADSLRQWILRPIYKNKKVTPVALTQKIQETICDVYGLPPENVPIIFNGRDLSSFLAKPEKVFRNIKRFIHVGRYAPQKNHERLIEGFAIAHKKYPHIFLDLIGEGELYDTIHKKIIQCGLEKFVRQLGRKQNVADYIADADSFILPSNYEGMPISLIEALACGLPCIVTPVGGVPDIIKNYNNGIFCDASAQSIAEAMERLICNPRLCNTIAKNARITSQKYSAEGMAHNYIDLYRKIKHSHYETNY